jgi:cytochrome c-type biogenesis protein CcmF
MEYIGEQLIWGKLGNAAIIASFTGALLSAVSYFISNLSKTDEEKRNWIRTGRIGYWLNSISVISIFGILLHLLFNHRYEYHYVWEHSNNEMRMKYILSCLWEGQEGSFLLWTFWNVVLGNMLILLAKEWESTVMTIYAIVQVFLASMILGIEVTDTLVIGSNPFTLTRLHPDFINMPFTKMADYLTKIQGRGLNPLLQNYWMVIHPPTLFLGFASTLVPFAYAIAGLWRKKYTEWLKPALPWTFFGIMVLGTGILMGGAWAYEALSFGGFWAWDPVENSSLVPWIVLVGAAHVMVIHKNKGQSLSAAFFLAIASFLLVLYSTFLTRSGILGDASVHAFTDLGMQGQLLVYMAFFIILAIVLWVRAMGGFPKHEAEEHLWSREFWMFIGALVLTLSAFHITIFTSRPVINKIFGTDWAASSNEIHVYNMWQLPFAFIITGIMGFGLFLKYKKTDGNDLVRKLAPALFISLIITIAAEVIFKYKVHEIPYLILFFSTTFAITANLDYIIRVLKGKIPKAGASIAHIGFALILLGALISTSRSKVISENRSGVDLGEEFKNNENILLPKNDTLQMGDYFISYRGDSVAGVNIYHKVEYFKKDNGLLVKAFTLHPLIQTNPRMGNVSEPDTRHFLGRDIYTHVTYDSKLQERERERVEGRKMVDEEGYSIPTENVLGKGDSVFTSRHLVLLDSIIPITNAAELSQLKLTTQDIAVKAKLRVLGMDGQDYIAEPKFIVRGNFVEPVDVKLDKLGLKFSFYGIDTQNNKVKLKIAERKDDSQFIIMKAIIFPGINILWIGCLIMILGSVLAIIHRVSRKNANASY